jgi:hypothetical protein
MRQQMAEPKEAEENKKPPNPNPLHPGNPKTAEQLKAEQEAQAERDEAAQKQQRR